MADNGKIDDNRFAFKRPVVVDAAGGAVLRTMRRITRPRKTYFEPLPYYGEENAKRGPQQSSEDRGDSSQKP